MTITATGCSPCSRKDTPNYGIMHNEDINGRDDKNCHPIRAITGLEDELQRLDDTFDHYVELDGDTMTGVLILSESPTNGSPASPPLQAATKEYVDLIASQGITSKVTDNLDGTYLHEDGQTPAAQVTIDTRASSNPYDNTQATPPLTSDNVQDAIDELIAIVDAGGGGTGNTSVITDNGDGTYTHDDGTGTTVTLDFNANALPYDNTNISPGLLGDTVQEAIDELAAGGGGSLPSDVVTKPELELALDNLFPIGFIQITMGQDPNSALPGTWTEISQGRMLIGNDTGDVDFDTPGKTGGEKTHTLVENELPVHNHGVGSHDHSIPAHGHNFSTDYSGEHHHFSSLGNSFRFVMREPGGSTSEDSVDQGPGPINTWECANTDDAGGHIHSGTTNNHYSSGTGTANGDTADAGNDEAHNNMPPYLVVKIWQRTA